MKRSLVAATSAAALFVVSGIATLPTSTANEPWKPACAAVGCVEPEVGARAPVGAELSFGQCADGKDYRYRFQRQAAGWVLVSHHAGTVDRCPDPPHLFTAD